MRTGSLTRLSRYFLRTLREDPADAEVASHRLMVRAGCVRRVAPGVYSWLPFGRRVLDNVAAVVREEMDRMGAQEVSLPALIPRELYESSGRWTEYGELLFRLADRKGADYLLAPTHEELFALLVKGELSSYRDYPVSLYQIGPKYRDEARPRAGVLRGREFLMKDSYSFDLDDEGLAASYAAHRAAYLRIFDRLGLRYAVVSAVSGAMGGSASEEFLAPTGAGEDTYVSCPACGYAANAEALRTPPVAVPDGPAPPLSVVDTPDTPTIDTLVASLRARGHEVAAGDTLKNLAVLLRRPGAADEVAIVSVPGDREVDLKRLNAQLEPAEASVADAAVLAAHPGLVRGYIGPQGLTGYRVLADPRVAAGTRWVTGANEPGRHALNVVADRDFTVDAYVEAVEVRAGDACPRCGGELSIERGIEVGHIFQLGRKYTDAFAVDALGPDGKPVRVTMGSYGIGISRAVAAIVEQSHDDAGIVWPPGVAPFDVVVLSLGKGEHVVAAAERVAGELVGAGRQVLLDDRGSSAGEKFADADLLGLPVQVIAGKAVAEGQVELKIRATGERRRVALADAVAAVADALASLDGNGAPAATR